MRRPFTRCFAPVLVALALALVAGCGSGSDGAVLIQSGGEGSVPAADIYQANGSPSAAGQTVVIDRPVTLSSDIRLATDRAWEFKKGGVVLTNGYSFDANGATIVAGAYRIFAGEGTVTGLATAKPEYFGASGDWNGVSGTDNTAAFRAAARASKRIELQRSGYKISDEIHFNPSVVGGNGGWRVVGAGNANSVTSGSFIYQAAPGKASFVFGDAAGGRYDQQSYLSDLGFTGVPTAIGIKLALTEDSTIERCKFSSLSRGVELATSPKTQVVKPRIYDCRFQSLDYGIIGLGTRTADPWIRSNLFQNNRLAHIDIAGEADGGYIADNIFAQDDTAANPACRDIYLQIPSWLHLEDNQFFNSAVTSVELTSPRNNFISRNTWYRSSQQNRDLAALRFSSQGSGIAGGNNKITNNSFVESFGVALQIDPKVSQDDLIDGNSFEGTGYGLSGGARRYDAMLLYDLDHARIVNNMVNGAGRDGGYPTVSTEAGSTRATLVSQAGGVLATGMALTGNGIAPDTTVTVSGTGIVLSRPALLTVRAQPMKAGSVVTRYGLSAIRATNSTITGNLFDNCLFPSPNYADGGAAAAALP